MGRRGSALPGDTEKAAAGDGAGAQRMGGLRGRHPRRGDAFARAAGHDPADAPAWKQYCAGRGNEWVGAVGAFVDVSAVPRGLRARHCRRAAAGSLAEKEKGST